MSLPAVVPAPASLVAGASAPFRLEQPVRIAGDTDAAAALAALISARTALAVHPSASSGTGGQGSELGEGVIELRIDPSTSRATGGRESYSIVVDEASVRVTGADAAGLFYGVQTLGQLLTRDGGGWLVPAVVVEDAPRFRYRGVMLDVARHFHSVDTVKAYIDRAAGLKLNVLHLHLSDDQGWRIQLSSRPMLTELASHSAVGGDPGGFYTKADYREIVEYAASRHVTVVPEIDMPGHTHAVGVAYPELAEAPLLSPLIEDVIAQYGGGTPTPGELYQGIAVGFSSLKIHDEATYDFLADVFGELAAMTPGPYLHVGGDEALGTDPDDFATFMERATDLVADLGKTPIAWHEAGAAAGLNPDTIGQYWGYTTPTEGMDDDARAFVRNGAQLILSPADAVYLDMKYDASTPIGLAWANGPTSVERAYAWEPGEMIAGVDESDILGVEAPLWAETVRGLADIDLLAFPRIAAAAEAAWSPPTGAIPQRSWESFRERVGSLGPLWTSLGIGFHPSDEIPWTTE
ncbi:family 20 glycosylhydrolase [Microbacterium sp. BK668]|uniref:family 20 glycosylhydrolase n=1 Tax=Microbacterium sp. BK668 TaxID=2512118 RepID=UPI00106006AA|nr:family 20 glycosylhydrolase [Microbacterium sp. BK668]TDN87713.1 hexosaminidase [Microbacterium sp. BK668]